MFDPANVLMVLNPFQTNGIFHKPENNEVRLVQCINWGVTGYDSRTNIVFPSQKMDFALAEVEDPDEMPHHAAFHLGLYHLPKFLFRGFRSPKG